MRCLSGPSQPFARVRARSPGSPGETRRGNTLPFPLAIFIVAGRSRMSCTWDRRYALRYSCTGTNVIGSYMPTSSARGARVRVHVR
eukprot:scaffold396253_cov27-Prasinocladus_malaysianus.AAC.1